MPNRNGQSLYPGVDLILMNQMTRAMNSTTFLRSQFVNQAADPRRNIDDECGYPSTGAITPLILKDMYDREPVAARVVEVEPLECWKVQPEVYEDEDSESVTAFEEAWDDLAKNLRGESWYQDEEGSPIWEMLLRVDILSGIGRYGLILLGLDDGKEPSEPAVGIDEKGKKKGEAKNKLIYLRSFDESCLAVGAWETDKKSPRYGQPTMYNVTMSSQDEVPVEGMGIDYRTLAVHWSRVIHVADNLGANEVIGVPRMRPMFNPLLDIRKVRSGDAEAYWRNVVMRIFLESHPQLGGDVELDLGALKDMMQNMENGLQRWAALTGLTAKPVAPSVVDPTSHIDMQIAAICIKMGIPQRIFVGSERGELASSQDERAWNDRCKQRQTNYVTPKIIVPFVNRLICLGVLPEPEGYSVVWPDLYALSEAEQAGVSLQRTQALAAYVSGQVESIMAPLDYLTRVMDMTEEEAQATLDSVVEHLEEANPDTEEAVVPGHVPAPPVPEPPPGGPIKMRDGETLVDEEGGVIAKTPRPPVKNKERRTPRPFVENWSPSQPRGPDGKWSSGGASMAPDTGGSFGGEGQGHEQTMQGEFWLNEGSSIFADGDVGDMNHEGYALDQANSDLADALGVERDEYDDAETILSRYAEENPDKAAILQGDDLSTPEAKELLEELNLDPETLAVAQGYGDARLWAAANHDWVRVAGNSVQTVGISGPKMSEIADGLYDAYGEEVETQSFDLEVITADSVKAGGTPYSKMYREVPFQVLGEGSVGSLRDYLTANWDPNQPRDSQGRWGSGGGVTDTPAFKEWFGDSKVVDENGDPQVVYHGTKWNVSVFEPGRKGAIFVSESPELASMMAEGPAKMHQVSKKAKTDTAQQAPNVMPLYVKLEKPFDHTNPEHIDQIAAAYRGTMPDHLRGGISRGSWVHIETPGVVSAIKRAGFDGFVIREADPVMGVHKNYAVFSPTQIKSASGNRGTFDPDDPIITHTANYNPNQPRDSRGRFSSGGGAGSGGGNPGVGSGGDNPTNTPEFKAWFGDSKVVDENGNPKVVYHGTSSEFTEFSQDALGSYSGAESAQHGFFFSDSPDVASSYPESEGTRAAVRDQNAPLSTTSIPFAEAKLERAEAATADVEFDEDEGGWVAKVTEYTQFGDPYTYSADDMVYDESEKGMAWDAADARLETIRSEAQAELDAAWVKFEKDRRDMVPAGTSVVPAYLRMENPLIHDFGGGDYREQSFTELMKEAEDYDYDGVIFKNVRDAAEGDIVSTVYAVFKPTQIKSASGNRGTFDPDDPIITHTANYNPNQPRDSRGRWGSGGAGGSFAETWSKIPVGERRGEWAKLSREERDAQANAGVTVKARQAEHLAGIGERPDTGDLNADVRTRAEQFADRVHQDARQKIAGAAERYADTLSKAGVDPADARAMSMDAVDIMSAQEMEAATRQLGDHGAAHITGNIRVASKIMDESPAEETARDLAIAQTAMIYHDTGYLAPPSQMFMDEGHPRWSAEHYNEHVRPTVEKALGKRAASEVEHIIRTHDAAEMDWDEDPIAAACRTADNTALFAPEKAPPILRYVPDNVSALEDFAAGKADLATTQRTMRRNIEATDLPPKQKALLHRGVDEVSESTPKFSLGMMGGELAEIKWDADANAPDIGLKENSHYTRLNKLGDFGQAQFAKAAKTYGLPPEQFQRGLAAEFRNAKGKTVLRLRHMTENLRRLRREVMNYSPSQPRDAQGRWGSGGGSGSMAPDTGGSFGGAGSSDDREQLFMDYGGYSYNPTPEKRAQMDRVYDAVDPAETPSQARKLGNKVRDELDAEEPGKPHDGVVEFLVKHKQEQLRAKNTGQRSSAEARADRVLKIKDSTGRSRGRRMN